MLDARAVFVKKNAIFLASLIFVNFAIGAAYALVAGAEFPTRLISTALYLEGLAILASGIAGSLTIVADLIALLRRLVTGTETASGSKDPARRTRTLASGLILGVGLILLAIALNRI